MEEDFEIGALLAASIRAIQEAQISAEREYLEFLLDYGVEEVREKQGDREVTRLRLREVAFDMTRQMPDPRSPGAVVETIATVRAPLLSLVQMPAIGISEATIDIELDVQTDVEATKKAEEEAASRPTATLRPTLTARAQPVRALPVLKGAVGSSVRNVKSRKHGRLSVKLTLRSTHDDDLHGRIARLIGEGLSATAETPEPGG